MKKQTHGLFRPGAERLMESDRRVRVSGLLLLKVLDHGVDLSQDKKTIGPPVEGYRCLVNLRGSDLIKCESYAALPVSSVKIRSSCCGSQSFGRASYLYYAHFGRSAAAALWSPWVRSGKFIWSYLRLPVGVWTELTALAPPLAVTSPLWCGGLWGWRRDDLSICSLTWFNAGGGIIWLIIRFESEAVYRNTSQRSSCGPGSNIQQRRWFISVPLPAGEPSSFSNASARRKRLLMKTNSIKTIQSGEDPAQLEELLLHLSVPAFSCSCLVESGKTGACQASILQAHENLRVDLLRGCERP